MSQVLNLWHCAMSYYFLWCNKTSDTKSWILEVSKICLLCTYELRMPSFQCILTNAATENLCINTFGLYIFMHDCEIKQMRSHHQLIWSNLKVRKRKGTESWGLRPWHIPVFSSDSLPSLVYLPWENSAHWSCRFHQVPITAGWTEAAWD